MITANEKLYITEKYANWNPGRFRYWESLPIANPADPQSAKLAEESKDKPALVLLHGYAASVEHWRRTFAGLKGRYRIYGLDLLGFGMSAKLPGSQVKYSAKLWATQVFDFLKYKGEEKVVIAGHSMGGMVAIQFALNYPEMLEGLVLVDSSGLPDQGKAELEAANNGRRRGGFSFGELTFNAIRLPLVGEMTAAVMANEWAVRQGLIQAYYKPEKVTPQLVEQFIAPLRTPGGPQAYLAVTRNFAEFQLPLQAGQLDHLPILLIWGEHDRSMPPNLMLPRWQKLLPKAETFLVQEAAHCPQDERPDIVNPQIMQFIEKVNHSSGSE